jgi:ABC-type Fe3+-hydroxamate transport system substrate-binding protein
MNRFISLKKFTLCLLLLSFVMTGCAGQKATGPAPQSTAPAATPAEPTGKKEALSYKGVVGDVSKKARTISIAVGPEGKTESMLVLFDDKTKGIEFAKKGDSVTIVYAMRDQQPVAVSIKPNLAKLPEGVTEIKTPELQGLVDSRADLVLIDARPESRYAQSHLPGAISVSVERMAKEMAAALPKEKDKMLVFYCGGPT